MSFRATTPLSFRATRGTCCCVEKQVLRVAQDDIWRPCHSEQPHLCHSEQREEPAVALKSRSFASLRMTSGVVSVANHHVLAKLVLELADDEIGRGLCRQSPGLHTLDAFEDDRVVLADLRVIRHEARVF